GMPSSRKPPAARRPPAPDAAVTLAEPPASLRQPAARFLFVYAVAIFAGAFLLFQVQPLIAKYILPWFGGSTGVWTTCMVFFQVLLLAGYAYAHVLTRFHSPRAQAAVHL